MSNIKCPECSQECTPVETDDSFSYSGTHCTHGQSGIHHLPIYYSSSCCGVPLDDYTPPEPDYPEFKEDL